MSSPPSLESRICGSLYGVAVADALGGPVEFCRRGSFRPVTSFRYNANFDLPPGTWTDDTSMTLCLAQSLVDTGATFDPQDQVKKYIRWHKQGYMSAIGRCFDIGNATSVALRTWKEYIDQGHEFTGGQAAIDSSLKRKVFSDLEHRSFSR